MGFGVRFVACEAAIIFVILFQLQWSRRRISYVNGDKADLQSQFSIAYVQAVASVAGFFVQNTGRGFDKDGIDMTVLERGTRWATTSTRLDLQVKSYTGEAQGDPWGRTTST